MTKEEGGATHPIPTIQEVLDRHFPGEYIAEELVIGDKRINLEEEDAGTDDRGEE